MVRFEYMRVNNTFLLRVAVLCAWWAVFFSVRKQITMICVEFFFCFHSASKSAKTRSESFSSNYRNVIVGRLDFFFLICRIGLSVGENMACPIELLCPDIVTNQIDFKTSRYLHVAFLCPVKQMWNVCTLV